jgi:hypothetical protein
MALSLTMHESATKTIETARTAEDAQRQPHRLGLLLAEAERRDGNLRPSRLHCRADISELSRARSRASRLCVGLPRSPSLTIGDEDTPGMLSAPRRGIHHRRTAVHNRPDV